MSHVVFSLASINLGAGSESDKVADLEALAGVGAHAIGVQEAGDRANALRRFILDTPGWAMLRPSGAGKVPILYDTRLLLMDPNRAHSVTAWEGGKVGPVGAGPSRIQPKALNHGAFRHLPTGRRVHVLNHHLIASHTRLLLPPAEKRARRAAAAAQAEAFEREADNLRGIVFGTGDWNATAPWVREHVPDFVIDNRGATHKRRQIDHVGHFPHEAVTVAGQWALETSGSRKNHDHRAVVVRYLLTVRDRLR